MKTFLEDEWAARALRSVLDAAVARLLEITEGTAVLAECPNKYNDGGEDDMWYAVQSGRTVWEQSHFFEGTTTPFVEEQVKFEHHTSQNDIISSGASFESELISSLRSILHELQVGGWRDLAEQAFIERRTLLALVLEHSQHWFVLETPNVDDGLVFIWDDDAFVKIGTVGRFDQAVGDQPVLVFKTVDSDEVHRLSEPARDYFMPNPKNSDEYSKLIRMLSAAVEVVQKVTDRPVALRSRDSRVYGYGFSFPESFCDALRKKEGEYRVPTNGEWPPYIVPGTMREIDQSDTAKGLHTALGILENGKWREVFGLAFGETLLGGQTLALFIDDKGGVLVRDNTAFRITPTALDWLGVFDYPNCVRPNDALVLAASGR